MKREDYLRSPEKVTNCSAFEIMDLIHAVKKFKAVIYNKEKRFYPSDSVSCIPTFCRERCVFNGGDVCGFSTLRRDHNQTTLSKKETLLMIEKLENFFEKELENKGGQE